MTNPSENYNLSEETQNKIKKIMQRYIDKTHLFTTDEIEFMAVGNNSTFKDHLYFLLDITYKKGLAKGFQNCQEMLKDIEAETEQSND